MRAGGKRHETREGLLEEEGALLSRGYGCLCVC